MSWALERNAQRRRRSIASAAAIVARAAADRGADTLAEIGLSPRQRRPISLGGKSRNTVRPLLRLRSANDGITAGQPVARPLRWLRSGGGCWRGGWPGGIRRRAGVCRGSSGEED